jgi:hypothetical protein
VAVDQAARIQQDRITAVMEVLAEAAAEDFITIHLALMLLALLAQTAVTQETPQLAMAERAEQTQVAAAADLAFMAMALDQAVLV